MLTSEGRLSRFHYFSDNQIKIYSMGNSLIRVPPFLSSPPRFTSKNIISFYSMKKEIEPRAYHLILRRCEATEYEARSLEYASLGVQFVSAWYEEADSADPAPHVHCIVNITVAKKTIQNRLNTKLPQYNNLHVLKELLTPEYIANAQKYVCKDWNPLITDDDTLAPYLSLRGVYNFETNMRMAVAIQPAGVAKQSHKENFNATICKDFELFYNQKDKKVTDLMIIDFLLDTYKCFQKDLDSCIIKRKFFMIKNMFRPNKDKWDLKKIVMMDLERSINPH